MALRHGELGEGACCEAVKISWSKTQPTTSTLPLNISRRLCDQNSRCCENRLYWVASATERYRAAAACRALPSGAVEVLGNATIVALTRRVKSNLTGVDEHLVRKLRGAPSPGPEQNNASGRDFASWGREIAGDGPGSKRGQYETSN